jgi:Domain of unknown function (DUF4259)
MGAWGSGSFDNDDASDFIFELEADATGVVVENAIARIADVAPDDYLDASEASRAIAAAEVVAACRGRPAPNLTDEVAAWATANASGPVKDLADRARQALRRILAGSELKELWDEQDDTEWAEAVSELIHRLS